MYCYMGCIGCGHLNLCWVNVHGHGIGEGDVVGFWLTFLQLKTDSPPPCERFLRSKGTNVWRDGVPFDCVPTLNHVHKTLLDSSAGVRGNCHRIVVISSGTSVPHVAGMKIDHHQVGPLVEVQEE